MGFELGFGVWLHTCSEEERLIRELRLCDAAKQRVHCAPLAAQLTHVITGRRQHVQRIERVQTHADACWCGRRVLRYHVHEGGGSAGLGEQVACAGPGQEAQAGAKGGYEKLVVGLMTKLLYL